MQAYSIPRSAYVHVPFCARRCGYCNFAIVVGRRDLADDYLTAIARELATHGPPREVDTLYFGGGTPTQLPLDKLVELSTLVKRWRAPSAGAEWTIEANPCDVTEELLGLLAQQGVTRLSLGGQSLHEEKLKLLERDHTADQVRSAVRLCREQGFSVALDLIFAAPGETLTDWRDDLLRAIELSPQHISTYGLTFEKGTAFWTRRRKQDLAESSDDLQRSMYLTAIDAMTAAGYEHYEVSNFALPGCRSRHNEVYWSGEPYDAFGPGAARYGRGVRETNHRSTTTYLKRVLSGDSPVAERECLTPEQRARERLVFGLRRLQGVDRAEFGEATGYEIDALAGDTLTKYAGLGLIKVDEQRVRLTREGLLVSDAIWPDLL